MEEKEQSNRKNARNRANLFRQKMGLTPVSRWLQNAFYAVWTLIGLILVVAFVVALLGNGTLTDNLQIGGGEAEETQQTEQQTQTPQQQQQPAQPTQEQLSCISDELGQERLAELEQGQPATQDESTVIQECLQ